MRFIFLVAFFVFITSNALAARRLVLIGGSHTQYHKAAIEKFLEWMPAEKKILRVSWASETAPEAELRDIHLKPFPQEKVVRAPSRFKMKSEKNEFLKSLAEAGGVYFTGGYQTRITGVFDSDENDEIRKALVKRYQEGVVFGGTSAGLAIMSRRMFTGNETLTQIQSPLEGMAKGLGLLESVLLDQHFFAEMRANRLISALESPHSEPVGLGVDEDSAITVEDERVVRVLGPNPVMAIAKTEYKGRYIMDILKPGQKYELMN